MFRFHVSNHQVDDSEVLNLVSSASLMIPWDIAWQELDLIFGLARLASGEQVLLNPADFGIVPAGGVQLPGVEVRGSDAGNIIYASSNSSVYGLVHEHHDRRLPYQQFCWFGLINDLIHH